MHKKLKFVSISLSSCARDISALFRLFVAAIRNKMDPTQYILADKGGINAMQSIHVRFIYDEMTFRFTYRCDGQPIWSQPITPASGSTNTLSPFVALATRA